MLRAVSRFYSTAAEAKYTAFSARTGITLPADKIKIALSPGKPQSTQYRVLGNHALSLYVSEYLLFRYPNLPGSACENALPSFKGVSALSDVANTFGLLNVSGWKPVPDPSGRTGEKFASANMMLALIGAIHKEEVRFSLA